MTYISQRRKATSHAAIQTLFYVLSYNFFFLLCYVDRWMISFCSMIHLEPTKQWRWLYRIFEGCTEPFIFSVYNCCKNALNFNVFQRNLTELRVGFRYKQVATTNVFVAAIKYLKLKCKKKNNKLSTLSKSPSDNLKRTVLYLKKTLCCMVRARQSLHTSQLCDWLRSQQDCVCMLPTNQAVFEDSSGKKCYNMLKWIKRL